MAREEAYLVLVTYELDRPNLTRVRIRFKSVFEHKNAQIKDCFSGDAIRTVFREPSQLALVAHASIARKSIKSV